MNFESKLKKKINEAISNVNSILEMGKTIGPENYNNKSRANNTIAHLSGIIKLHAYVQFYNKNFSDPKMVNLEKEVKDTLDSMQDFMSERTSELFNLEDNWTF